MRALITGINGFVGGHLAELLIQTGGWEIWGLDRSGTLGLPHLQNDVRLLATDLCNADAVQQAIAASKPQAIFHLAGQAFVPESFRDPAATLTTNIFGLMHILLALIEQQHDCRVLVVGSNEEYGCVQPEDVPVSEDTPLRPISPYGVSKVAQDLLALQYHLSHQLDVVRVRPFNHIGPRQNERFVASAFARQIAQIEQGLQSPVIKVGDLSPQRDFTDVRDMVRAYLLAVESGQAGQVYNLGSGVPVTIRTILDHLIASSTTSLEVQPDPERMRPVDMPVVACNAEKFRAHTGWTTRIPLEQTLRDILDDWRARIQQGTTDPT